MIASSILSGALSVALAVSGAPAAAALESSSLTGSRGLSVTSAAASVRPGSDLAGYGGLLDLFGYQSTLAGTQLTAAGGITERAAWSAQKGAISAQDSLLYNARSVYGLEKGLGSVTPLTPGMDLPPKLFGKFSVPKYGGVGLRAGAGPLTAALIGWELRGKMTDGVMGFTGLGAADGAVCASTAGGDATASGFVNWLTDSDCEMWKANQDWLPNVGQLARPDGWDVASLPYPATGTPSHVIAFSTVTSSQASFTAVKALQDFGWAGGYISYKCWNGTAYGTPITVNPPGSMGITPPGTARTVTVTLSCTSPQTLGQVQWKWGSTNLAQWGAVGTPAYTAGADADPARTRVCDQTGSDGLHYIGTTAIYHDSDIAAGTPFPQPVCAPLPQGVTSAHLLITETGGSTPKTLLDQDSIADDPAITAITGGQPAEIYCRTKICLMDLVDLTEGVSCFSENDACDGWWKDPNRDTKYACNYAGATIGIAQCALYAHLFNTQKRLAGDPYADPLTGEDTNVANGPSIDRELMAGLPRASMDGRDCFGAGYNAPNPIQWVLRPLQCEAEWAWMPRASVVEATTVGIQGSWADTAFGKIDTLMGPFKAMPSFTGCSGLPIDIEETWPMDWGIHWRLGAACDGPLATLAGTVRVVLAGLIGMSGVMVLSDYLGWGIGFRGFGRRS